jgi:hypothetical protein
MNTPKMHINQAFGVYLQSETWFTRSQEAKAAEARRLVLRENSLLYTLKKGGGLAFVKHDTF